MEKEKKKQLGDQAEELEDSKDAVKIFFYMFWKHNRNANFSYLPTDALAAEAAECLERLGEEEAAAAQKDVTPHNPKALENFSFYNFIKCCLRDTFISFETIHLKVNI